MIELITCTLSTLTRFLLVLIVLSTGTFSSIAQNAIFFACKMVKNECCNKTESCWL